MKGMGRYWGYLLFAVVIMGWTTRDFPFVAIIVLSLASTFYFLFQVPTWCGAITRQGTLCRRAYGN